MIELRRIKAQYLNGSNIVKQISLPDIKTFADKKELESFRKSKEAELQQDIEPGHDTRISIVFDYIEKP